MTYKIVMKDALKRLRDAYNANKLGSQGKHTACYYKYPKSQHMCGVGAMLPKEVHKEIEKSGLNGKSVLELSEQNIISCTTYQLNKLLIIQTEHDSICRETKGKERKEANIMLGKYINKLCSKYKVA